MKEEICVKCGRSIDSSEKAYIVDNGLVCFKCEEMPADEQEKIKTICPNCGVSLKGVVRKMIGDIGVCTKCKAEFTIQEITPDAPLCPARLKKKARGQIRGGIWVGILLVFMLVSMALVNHSYYYFIPAGLLILYIFSVYKRQFYVTLVLWAFFTCGLVVGCIMIDFSTTTPFLRFAFIFWGAVFCYGLLGPILGMLNEKKATQD